MVMAGYNVVKLAMAMFCIDEWFRLFKITLIRGLVSVIAFVTHSSCRRLWLPLHAQSACLGPCSASTDSSTLWMTTSPDPTPVGTRVRLESECVLKDRVIRRLRKQHNLIMP